LRLALAGALLFAGLPAHARACPSALEVLLGRFWLLLLEVLDAPWLGELGFRFGCILTFDFHQNCSTTELLNE
jgi:hypothetical protein